MPPISTYVPLIGHPLFSGDIYHIIAQIFLHAADPDLSEDFEAKVRK